MSNSTKNEKIEVSTRRHSASHVLAQALKKRYPDVKLAIGPDIENGFYYDVMLDGHIREEDLPEIEKSMKEIAKAKQSFERFELPVAEAIARLSSEGEIFKVEMAQDLAARGESVISFYKNLDRKGETVFVDMCAGPHVEHTGDLGAFKLRAVSGAYWRGDAKREQLQRVYGLLFDTREELAAYEEMVREAERRDHRRIGEELNLFSIQEDAGGGLVFWHPRGARIRRQMENFWYEKHEEGGYQFLYTPHIANLDLWKTSGHTDFYADSMYQPMEDENLSFQLKPMNCPFHVLVFKDRLRSYRELPFRWAEMGTVYRKEMSGALHGLMRVRGFTQDDAHIFCREDQIETEVIRVIDFILEILGTFGFHDYEINLSTRPEKSVGSEQIWELATAALRGALEHKGLAFDVDEGGGAFYGPKIDIKICDAIGRKWQCSTVQLDFNLPERFDMEYVTDGNERARPIMIHRALLGSVERFFGVLIEHYTGAFPLWLAPEQLRIIPVADKFADYARSLEQQLSRRKLRVSVDDSDETLGKRIRNAEKMKIPYMAVVGEKELESGRVNVRNYFTGEQSEYRLEELIELMDEEIREKRIQMVVKGK